MDTNTLQRLTHQIIEVGAGFSYNGEGGIKSGLGYYGVRNKEDDKKAEDAYMEICEWIDEAVAKYRETLVHNISLKMDKFKEEYTHNKFQKIMKEASRIGHEQGKNKKRPSKRTKHINKINRR